jgi:hypothetical protein
MAWRYSIVVIVVEAGCTRRHHFSDCSLAGPDRRDRQHKLEREGEGFQGLPHPLLPHHQNAVFSVPFRPPLEHVTVMGQLPGVVRVPTRQVQLTRP